MILLILATVVILGLATAAIVLARTMGRGGQALPLTPEWINDLSVEQYRPMLRLLDSADIEFLRTQPGYSQTMETKLRQQRCNVFRGYLRCLTADFQRVCTALKLLMTQSEQDRPDLAGVLMHQQLLFATGLLSIHCRLALYRVGVCNVEVGNLVRIFDRMRIELRTLVPAASSSCA